MTVEILAMIIGLMLGGFGMWFVKRKVPETSIPVEPHTPNIQKVETIDASIPSSSGRVDVDDLVSWADRGRARNPDGDAK